MFLGTLIGFLNVVKSNSLLAIEDHCLALKDVSMDRVPCCPLVIRQKSRLQIQYLKSQFSEMARPKFVKGLVFLWLNKKVLTLEDNKIAYCTGQNMCFNLASRIHLATVSAVRSHARCSYLLHGFRLGQRLAFHVRGLCSLLANEIHVKLTRFLHRFWTTLQGSSEDIGWLQRTQTSPCSVDGTSRFKELLHDVRNGMRYLPNTLVYLLIPGLFSNHSPLYFLNTKRFFSKMGLTCHIAKIHSEASVEKNAWELKLYIEELYWGSGKQVLLLGHSKGGVDAAAALSLYWSELKGKVAGLALVQSPYGGTPVASDILREGQIADKETRRIMELIVCKLIKGDMRALEDLTYDRRKDFISRHKLPVDELPIISFHTEASTAPTVLATLTRIAHAELLPLLPLPCFLSEYAESLLASLKLPVVMPVSAAMAVSALHLRLRYGERSDGLVTRRDAEVPGSVVVRPERRLDHAWLVFSTLRRYRAEADATEVCEALLAMLVEIGRKKCR